MANVKSKNLISRLIINGSRRKKTKFGRGRNMIITGVGR